MSVDASLPDDLMTGSPPPTGALVTLENWQDPPYLRWAYMHVRELIPTAAISRGDAPVTPLPRAERDLDGLTFSVRGERHTVGEMLATTDTDGFLVLHHGRILVERYRGAMTETTPHLLQSVSKSMTSALAGALIAADGCGPTGWSPTTSRSCGAVRSRGARSRTCWTCAPARGSRRSTRTSTPTSGSASRCPAGDRGPGRTSPGPLRVHGHAREPGPHGGPFEYRSILTDVLGWVLERAGGDSFARLYSRHVWSRIGAEHDAEVTLDPHGAAIEDGGISVTLRDLGRFGLMHARGGEIGGRRVLPASWAGGVGVPRPDLVNAFGGALTYDGVATPTSHYHNQWWIFDADRGVYGGIGIHGQALVIHRAADAVIVKVSTQADPLDREKHELQLAGAIAIGDALAREG